MTNNSTAVSNVIPFAFEAKSVRVQEIDGSPWFCVTDVCSILGYSNSRDAMSKHCREKGVAKRDTLTSKGKQALTFIDEGNLYRLIIKSRKEEAQRFESWVCDEVLPAIRKTGRYEDQGKMSELMDQLSLSQFNTIKGVIRDKIKAAPAEKRQGLQLVMHNRLHTRFNVPRTELIPASQLEAACNFIAAYALEGEYMPHQPSHAGRLNIHFPIDSLTCRRPEMLTDRGNGHAWLDVKIADLRENFGSPCEAVLCELSRAGYDVTGAWWEVRTLRNKLQQVSSFITSLNRVVEDPQRYAVKEGVAA